MFAVPAVVALSAVVAWATDRVGAAFLISFLATFLAIFLTCCFVKAAAASLPLRPASDWPAAMALPAAATTRATTTRMTDAGVLRLRMPSMLIPPSRAARLGQRPRLLPQGLLSGPG